MKAAAVLSFLTLLSDAIKETVGSEELMSSSRNRMWKLHGDETFACSDIGQSCCFPAGPQLPFIGGFSEVNGGDFRSGVQLEEVPQNHQWTPLEDPFSESITVEGELKMPGETLRLIDWCSDMMDSCCAAMCDEGCWCQQPSLDVNDGACDLTLSEDHDTCIEAKVFTLDNVPHFDSSFTLKSQPLGQNLLDVLDVGWHVGASSKGVWCKLEAEGVEQHGDEDMCFQASTEGSDHQTKLVALEGSCDGFEVAGVDRCQRGANRTARSSWKVNRNTSSHCFLVAGDEQKDSGRSDSVHDSFAGVGQAHFSVKQVDCLTNTQCFKSQLMSSLPFAVNSSVDLAVDEGTHALEESDECWVCGLGHDDRKGLWCKIAGDGNCLRLHSPSRNVFFQASVFMGNCSSLVCVGHTDRKTPVEWQTQPKEVHHIFISTHS